MWHPVDGGAYGFEALRPNEDGELEVLKVTLTFEPNKAVISGPDKTYSIFEHIDHEMPRVEFSDQYLLAYFDGHWMEFKIEPSEGLVCDQYEDEYGPVGTLAIWWEDL